MDFDFYAMLFFLFGVNYFFETRSLYHVEYKDEGIGFLITLPVEKIIKNRITKIIFPKHSPTLVEMQGTPRISLVGLIHFLLCYVPAQIMIIISLLLSFTNHNMSNHILSLAYKLTFFYGWPMFIILIILDDLCHKIYLFIKKTRNKQKTGVVKMKKELSFIINEKKHIIKFVNGKLFKGEKLYVDGNEIEIENKLLKFFGIYDQEFTIDGKKCRAIFIGKDIDVVVNNKYVYSQKPYIPVNGISWWVWIYVVLSILIPIVAIGGALPTIIGILSLFWCVRTSVTPSISTLKKHFFCITIVMIAWLLFVSLVLG